MSVFYFKQKPILAEARRDGEGSGKNVRPTRSLQIPNSPNLPCASDTHLKTNRLETTFFQTRDGNGVVPEVEFGADEKDGGGRGVVADFRDPLRSRVSVNREQSGGGGGEREGKTYFLLCKMLLTREQIENARGRQSGDMVSSHCLLSTNVSRNHDAPSRAPHSGCI